MHISFHLGAHGTDAPQLVKSLRKNLPVLTAEGIAVPETDTYRDLLRETMQGLRGEKASKETQEQLLETLIGDSGADRLVLSNDSFISAGQRALENGVLYTRAREKTVWMRNLFPEAEVEFFLCVRNPATWVPEMNSRVKTKDFAELTRGMDPDLMVWSDVIRDIREVNPDSPVTVWCFEDTPLIWPEVLHEVTGLDPQIPLMGGFDILSQIMEREGVKRLRTYLGEHPPVSEIQRRRVLTAFLDKYAMDEKIEEELDLPGWSPELIEHLTDVYDDDMIEIARIPGVTLITA